MKCGRLAGWWMLVVFFLFVGGCFSSGFAAGAARGEQSSRAAGLAAEAPKTPEEFLRLVRAWMDDPYMDGYEFAEQVTGIERQKWIFDLKHSESNVEIKRYYIIGNNFLKKRRYGLGGIQITSNNHLWDIIIPFPDKSFCVSAGLVREILGEPTEIKGRLPNKSFEFGPEQAVVYYYYKTANYEIDINFPLEKGKFKDRARYSRKERKKMKALLRDQAFHRDICAGNIRFGTYEGR